MVYHDISLTSPWSHLGRPFADDDHHRSSPPAGVDIAAYCPRLFPLYLQQYSLLYPGLFVPPRGMTSSTLYQRSIQVSPFFSRKGGIYARWYTLIASIAYKWGLYLATVLGHTTKYLPRVKRQETGCIRLQLLQCSPVGRRPSCVWIVTARRGPREYCLKTI